MLTKITNYLMSIKMPSELFVPVISHGNERRRLITLCGNSNSSKVDDALVGICLAYYITANINKCWRFGAHQGVPEAVACDQQHACMKADVEEPCKEHRASLGLCREGSVWEFIMQTRNGWCKVGILKGLRVLKQGNRWFIVQLLFFLLVLQVPAGSWSHVLTSPTAGLRSWGQSPCKSCTSPSHWQALGAALFMT